MKKSLLMLFTILLISNVNAQEEEKYSKVDFALEGMAGIAFGKNFTSFNVGGPSLLLNVNQKVKIGFGALPSFYIRDGKTGAKLGVAPRLDIKNWVFFVPFYHFDTTDEWLWSVGVGYKFHKK
ncbi:hypothetical protein A33Q_2339 [Indibacter alkaliphilus LW1]|uniref:Outer membrane protein beta-barrel domain-containing protein n=1 Tax=Indibacter alkaliphilus (strain CCUG 57479 / KCTC 22604 / LW1) TaxID=1189612 RepID=S2DCF6_INDAL|nr:hypothetical protein [Indibacter alkaliphilus]EOZ96569.1 hypothetical protein A33Q_2339 [Indibacter alkaliphilus LW1]